MTENKHVLVGATGDEEKDQCRAVTVDEVENQLSRILNAPIRTIIPDYNQNTNIKNIEQVFILESKKRIIKASIYKHSHLNQEDFTIHHHTDAIGFDEPHIHFSVLGIDKRCGYEIFLNFYTADEFEYLVGLGDK